MFSFKNGINPSVLTADVYLTVFAMCVLIISMTFKDF